MTRRLLTCYFLVFFQCISFSQESLTVQQVFSLMKASKEQYNSFDASIEIEITETISEKTETIMSFDIVSRWTKDCRYAEIKRISHRVVDSPDFSKTSTDTYAFTPKWEKALTEAPNKIPHGYITADEKQRSTGGIMGGISAYTCIRDTMWEIFGASWESLDVDKGTVLLDKETGLYIVEVRLRDVESGRGPLYRLCIDPSKGFIPVDRKYIRSDGKIVAEAKCYDLRQTVNGLWVPHGYDWIASTANIVNSQRIREVKVNEPIPDQLFDFAFPKGTIVDDQISNLRYEIDNALIINEALDAAKEIKEADGAISTNSVLDRNELAPPRHSQEADLQKSASQVGDLLGNQIVTKRGSSIIYYILLISVMLITGIAIVLRSRKKGKEIQ